MVRHFLSPVVTKAVAASVVGCALLVLPTQARAQDPAPAAAASPAMPGALGQGFGEQGQLVITGELNTAFDKVNNAGWLFRIQPAADYFFMPSVSAGLVAAFVFGSNDYKEQLIGARAGYNLNVTENLGAWAKAGVAYDHISGGFSTTWLTLDLPILYHIVPHVFVGVGPYYYLKVAGDGNTGYGFHSLVGAWF
jgi:hypothetical protein